jgi:uncharacterized protein YtpQ (UPF0354 family)
MQDVYCMPQSAPNRSGPPKRLRRQIGLLCVSVIASNAALSQDIPKSADAFTEYVAGQLRLEVGNAAVAVKGPLTLSIGYLQANLDRIYAYCKRDAAGCAQQISTYVKGVAQVHKDGLEPPTKDAVRIIVRTRAYVTASQAALPKQAPKRQLRELAGELVVLPAIDMPRTVRVLNEKDGQTLGLSTNEVFTLGFSNVRKRLKPLMEVAKVVQPGQIGHISGDVYNSSRLALHESWAPLVKAQGGQLVVAVPTTDAVLYVGDNTSVGINALRAFVTTVLARAPNPLSKELFRWTANGWEVVH